MSDQSQAAPRGALLARIRDRVDQVRKLVAREASPELQDAWNALEPHTQTVFREEARFGDPDPYLSGLATNAITPPRDAAWCARNLPVMAFIVLEDIAYGRTNWSMLGSDGHALRSLMLDNLAQAGAIEKRGLGYWRITGFGREVLDALATRAAMEADHG